ncbi:MAG: BamA/TamA family outer membrane protein [Bacteroidota bacterium]
MWRPLGAPIPPAAFLLLSLLLPQGPARSEETPPEVEELHIEGNNTFGTGALEALLGTRETPGFLGKFFYGISGEVLGRNNEFFDPGIFAEDIRRVVTYYRERGFFAVEVDTSVTGVPDGGGVRVRIRIREGDRARIDTLSIEGLLLVPEFVHADIAEGRLIGVGEAYDQRLLKTEVDRVLQVLQDAGYANARFDQDSSAAVRLASTGNCRVRLVFDTGRRYFFGPVGVQREGEKERSDITDEIVLRQLDYAEEEVYNASHLVTSERNLNRVGLFDLARVRPRIPPREDTTLRVPSRVTIRPTDKHELAPELLLNDENGNFNLGTGLGYKNRNFLGGARTFSSRIRFRTETIGRFPDYFALAGEGVANADLTLEMFQPYIFSRNVRGNWTVSLILDKQRPYRQFIVRNRFGLTDQLADYTHGYLDWTLERVSLQRNPHFTGSFEEAAELEAQARRVQFNSILSFTLQRNKANDVFSPSAGFIHAATLEESGLLPLLLRNAQPDLPFTQFYRVILLGRWYYDLSHNRFAILGLKLKGGWEEKYGESRSDAERAIPQTHRFFAGGGASVRGWESRRLAASGDPRLELGGNLALEGSAELRVNALRHLRSDLLRKLWVVFFLDAGNVWAEARDLKAPDVAVAAGLGIRYETFFGPFRVDFGFRIHDPGAEEGGRKWIFRKRLLGETLARGILHFGIGHAF